MANEMAKAAARGFLMAKSRRFLGSTQYIYQKGCRSSQLAAMMNADNVPNLGLRAQYPPSISGAGRSIDQTQPFIRSAVPHLMLAFA